MGRLEWGPLAHSTDILALVDPRGTILYINHSAERIMTRSIENELVGHNIFECTCIQMI